VEERGGLLDRLGEINVPLLVVHGKEDETWGPNEAVALRDGLVNGAVTFHVVEDVGIWSFG
jgi:pimeloyl-ACP methyl ester carboxylesterase